MYLYDRESSCICTQHNQPQLNTTQHNTEENARKMLSLGLLEAVAPLLGSADAERRLLATVFVAGVCHVVEGAAGAAKLRCAPALVKIVKTDTEKAADAAMRAFANAARHRT